MPPRWCWRCTGTLSEMVDDTTCPHKVRADEEWSWGHHKEGDGGRGGWGGERNMRGKRGMGGRGEGGLQIYDMNTPLTPTPIYIC